MPQKYDKVVIRKINIIDRESDATKQAIKDFGLKGIPYIRIYSPDGTFLSETSDIEEIERTIQAALK